jgi:carbamoyl-phosphate synthase large subunit
LEKDGMKKGKVTIIRGAVGSMPSWGLIEELQSAGVEIIGIDSNPLSFSLYLLKKSYVVPRGDNPNFIKEMLKIIDKEQPDAILSGPEEELLTLSKNKGRIEERGTLLLCPDYEYVEICADKKKTYEVFNRIKIPSPMIFDDTSLVEFPCIIKPRFGRGSSNIYVAKEEEDLRFYLKKIEEPVIQEFVQGEEYTVDILADKDGSDLSIVPRLRLHTESGISVKGKTVYDNEIIDYSKRIAKKLKLFGPSCIQCIRNDDGVKFIEVNTRFGGGSILSIKADPTIIPNLIKMIKDDKPEPSKGFKEGLVMLRYHSEVFLVEEEIKESGEFP